MNIRGLKETVKMRWKKVGQTRANLDLKSWNKILRSGGPGSGLEIFTFNGFRGGRTSGHGSFTGQTFTGKGGSEALFTLTP